VGQQDIGGPRLLERAAAICGYPFTRRLDIGCTVEAVEVLHEKRDSFNVTMGGRSNLNHYQCLSSHVVATNHVGLEPLIALGAAPVEPRWSRVPTPQ
jgi:hypothetical protein